MKLFHTILFLLLFSSLSAQEDILKGEDNSPGFQSLFNAQQHLEVACYRIPSIITAPNGDLIAAIDERGPSCGDLKWNNNINIVMRRSMDNGKTWTDIETVVDYPEGQSASDPSMIVDEISGDIFLFFNFMDLEKEKDVYYLRYVVSSDNGKTWTAPQDITAQISQPEWHNDFKFITSGRGIQTRDGKLLHTLVNLQRGLFVFGSNDHGQSWYFLDTPISPADESKLVELNDGRWMINSRVNKAGLRYVHISTDEGQTWSSRPDSTLVDPGCNASILYYPLPDKDLLLFSNANSSDKRHNLTLKLSFDQGKSWTQGKTIYTGPSAYSSMTILKNGDIGLFFEKDDYQDNVFVRIPLAWLSKL
jgi:sialidase-1